MIAKNMTLSDTFLQCLGSHAPNITKSAWFHRVRFCWHSRNESEIVNDNILDIIDRSEMYKDVKPFDIVNTNPKLYVMGIGCTGDIYSKTFVYDYVHELDTIKNSAQSAIESTSNE